MNVYDFDGTIYDGDSTVDFWKFCLKRHPLAVLSLLPTIIWAAPFALRIVSKTSFKQRFFKFLCYIPDVDKELNYFWEKHETKIKTWYLSQKQGDDLIISASPEFLLAPICEKLGVSLIASSVDKHTGIYTGVNCDGEEKVRRLSSQYPGEAIELFYSDSQIDAPLARIAKSAYMVRGVVLTPWAV